MRLPEPPPELCEPWPPLFRPDGGDLAAFTRRTILADSGDLYNEDHAHLGGATIGFLWTNVEGRMRGTTVAGSAQIPLKGGGDPWSMGMRRQQLEEWFEEVPDFLITLDAQYWASRPWASRLALLEHELYHCAQSCDEFGMPRVTADGDPVWDIRPHDVEEFVGVVRRYGPGPAAGQTVKLVQAATHAPEVGEARLSAVCGTCLRR